MKVLKFFVLFLVFFQCNQIICAEYKGKENDESSALDKLMQTLLQLHDAKNKKRIPMNAEALIKWYEDFEVDREPGFDNFWEIIERPINQGKHNYKNEDGKTLLCCLCNEEDEFGSNNFNLRGVIKLLIEKANPNIPDNEGNYPLHFAVAKGSIRQVVLLLHFGAKVDVKNKKDELPLDWAKNITSETDQKHIIELLNKQKDS